MENIQRKKKKKKENMFKYGQQETYLIMCQIFVNYIDEHIWSLLLCLCIVL